MKAIVSILVIIIVPGLYWSCEPESHSPGKEPIIIPKPNGNAQSNTPITSEWVMEVISVDTFTGGNSNEAFIDILLGNPLASGISTTNTSSFKLYSNSDKVELWLGYNGWTLWKVNGLNPVSWEFKYIKSNQTLELEGFANMGLSNCDVPIGSTLVNRFYFIGGTTGPGSFYSGRYVWSETYETGTCIWIEGEMIVYQPFL